MYRQLPEPVTPCSEHGSIGFNRSTECEHCAVRHLAICSALSSDEVAELDEATTSLPYSAGSTLVRAGEARQFFFTVTSGALRMVRTLADGRRQITGFVLPSDFVGLTETARHRHDIEAIVDTRVCRVPMTAMREMRQKFPQLERKLLQRTCMELAMAQDTGLLLARLQPSERLANFLLRLWERAADHKDDADTVYLPMGRGDIADHLGLTMETVSRTFTKLRQQQLIALPQLHVVQILDFKGLKQLAGDIA